ncbi:Maf family protein [Roseburia hominis]
MFEDRTVILASASPRRTELLAQAGIAHIVIPSTCEEKITSSSPRMVVMDLSRQKALDVYAKYQKAHPAEDFLIIGSDTVVSVGEEILGKPKDEEEAYHMLSMLQDAVHQVYTGVTLLSYQDGKMEENTFYECSNVQVCPMSVEEICRYIATGEPMDKAGAYGIQGRFAVHIRAIEGDYNTIVGLPIARIYQELKKER